MASWESPPSTSGALARPTKKSGTTTCRSSRLGSGLGYSYGFPLTLEGSAPSVVNFTSTQSLFNLSLKQFLKAAKIDWKAASFDVQDKRAEVILDTALSYAQLVNLSGKINTLSEAQKAAEKAQFITEQRLKEGVDSQLDLTKSQLAAARIRLRIADAQGQKDVLREHLAKLTGLTPAEIQPDPESMPHCHSSRRKTISPHGLPPTVRS